MKRIQTMLFGGLLSAAFLFGSVTHAQQKLSDQQISGARTGMKTEREKKLIRQYTKKIRSLKSNVKTEKPLPADWFVTGVRAGDNAQFRAIQNEKNVIDWSVKQTLKKRKNVAWKVIARFSKQENAQRYVLEMNKQFQIQLAQEKQAARNAEIARRQALLGRQQSQTGGHSSGSC